MQDCPKPEEIQEYTDGQLPGTEAARVAEHISHCPRCEAVHRWLVLISHNLSARPRPEPSAELVGRIRRAVDLAKPVEQISCSDAQSLISTHLDGELTAPEQLLMWRHLFGCQTCYQQFIQTQEITKALRHAGPIPLPASLEANIHKAVDAEIARRAVGVISLLRWRISKRALGATVAAAAALLIGLLLIPQQPATKAPQMARGPAEVTAPIEVAVTPTQPLAAEEPEVAQPPTSPSTVIARTDRTPARRTAVRVAANKPTPTSHRAEETSVDGATLASVGAETPKPVSRIAPPTNTDEGSILTAYWPGATPVLPSAGEKPSRIEYTPVATAGESIYANLEPVADSRLDAATEGVNDLVAMNVSYSKRPELEIVH